MTFFLSKVNFLSANSVFAVQIDSSYLPQITRETCTVESERSLRPVYWQEEPTAESRIWDVNKSLLIVKGRLWVRLLVCSTLFYFFMFWSQLNQWYIWHIGGVNKACWKNQPGLMSIKCSKRLAAVKIRTQAHQSWDVNRGGYVTWFLDRIPMGILPLVNWFGFWLVGKLLPKKNCSTMFTNQVS